MFKTPDFNIGGMSDFTSQKIGGVMIGVVTNNNDPDKLGRVKLKLPMQNTETETDWVRIATFMGGNDMGSLFIPEVNDEVLVAFHLGELRMPIVIGMLWNPKQKPPAPADKNDLRMIKSRSGHTLSFNDKSGDESITIKTKKGQIVEMKDKDGSISIADASGNNKMLIKGGSANEISIVSQTSKITLNAKGEVSIESTKEIKIKSTQLSIEASATMALKAGATLDIKSDGIINIKGSMVKIN
ncbi:phage baseplate assembly protein V [Paenibacillus roseipurpureus]|uniref:Phage baseplate assembly protein V n=1 Tax=Paenibacillus roseopurpureus TaxID=2918901 RepID=A0AA96LLR6_9BACL|nr:phage baseplate assembly protein V [Paenibacillus sp. MBLB1832]WNR44085.1 phage baseplate assembly protein V [Paenibacillus sp. MBLB1832]